METTFNDHRHSDRPNSSYFSINRSSTDDPKDENTEDWMQEYCKAMECGKIKDPSVYSFKDKPWITEECKRYLCIKLFYKKKSEKYKTDHYNKLLKIAKDKCKTILRSTKEAYEADQKCSDSLNTQNSDAPARQDNFFDEDTPTSQPTCSSSTVKTPKASSSNKDGYPIWYDRKCKEMAVLKEYYQSILEMNDNDAEAMNNFRGAKKKLRRLEKDANRKYKAKNMKLKNSTENEDEMDVEDNETRDPNAPSWRHINDDKTESLEVDDYSQVKEPIEEKGKWQPVPWKKQSDRATKSLVEEKSDEEVLEDINKSPLEKSPDQNKKRARYGQDDIESGELSDDDFKNSSWQVFSSKELKKKKRKRSSDQKLGDDDDDDDSSMDGSRSPKGKNSNQEPTEGNGPSNNYGPNANSSMMQPWQSNFNSQGVPIPGAFSRPPPGSNFNGGFQQPSGSGFFNQGPPGPGFNNQGPPRFTNQGPPPPMYNNQGPPPMFNNEGPPPMFNNNGPPPMFNNQGSSGGFNNQGPSDFNNQGQSGGFNNQGPPGGCNNQGPPRGFNNQGPPGGFNNQGPSGGFNSRGPSGGFNNRGPPAFNNQRPSGFSNYNSSGFPMQGPPRPPFNHNSSGGSDSFQAPPGFNGMPPNFGPPDLDVSEQTNDGGGGGGKKEKSKHSSSSTKSRSRRSSSSGDKSEGRKADAKFCPFPPPPQFSAK